MVKPKDETIQQLPPDLPVTTADYAALQSTPQPAPQPAEE